jgi:hypothetical protein
MQKITVALTMGNDPALTTDEERSFAESVRKDIQTAKDAGGQVGIPGEWEVDTEGDI